IRQGGTYLITGGTGALGWLLARHLATTYAARLILTGRSPLDAARTARIAELEAATGVCVRYVRTDVCDAEGMATAIALARDDGGSLHGVFHVAGIVAASKLADATHEAFEDVLRPKIDGTLTLTRLLDGVPLDFVCYFSSSSAILGDFGA